jgi:GNAT superfamily N-acetyltransferase
MRLRKQRPGKVILPSPVLHVGSHIRYLAGKMRLSTLTVHPAYWGRGHATRLVSWCTRLAGKAVWFSPVRNEWLLTILDMEGVAIGISAAPMGATLAAHAGFEERELLRVKSRASPDRPSVSDVVLWIGIRPPSRSPSDTNTGSSDSPSSDAEALVAHTKVV